MKKPLLCLALLALATSAVAQENPARLALARDVIALMKVDQMFDGMAAQMKQSVNQMVKLAPGATPEEAAQAAALRTKITDMAMEETKAMISKSDHLYAEIYSEVELTAIKAFYSSPGGQSMLAKQPQLMARLMPMIQEMQRGLNARIKQALDEAKTNAQNAAATPGLAPAPAPFSVPAPK